MTLTLADASRVISGAIAKATEIGAKMNFAVCDAGGRAAGGVDHSHFPTLRMSAKRMR